MRSEPTKPARCCIRFFVARRLDVLDLDRCRPRFRNKGIAVEERDASFCAPHLQVRAEWWGDTQSNCSGTVNELREEPANVTTVARFRRPMEPPVDEKSFGRQRVSHTVAPAPYNGSGFSCNRQR